MFKKKKIIVSEFVMRADKVKGLKAEGFNIDEIIIFKEELGKLLDKKKIM